MNQKEAKARDMFREQSQKILKIKLVENQAGQSTSDSAVINRFGDMFWIEFKAIDDWPKRETTCPLKDSFKPGQIPFLLEWISWNGNGFVLLRVEKTNEWFLFKPSVIIDFRQFTQQELRNISAANTLDGIINLLGQKQ